MQPLSKEALAKKLGKPRYDGRIQNSERDAMVWDCSCVAVTVLPPQNEERWTLLSKCGDHEKNA